MTATRSTVARVQELIVRSLNLEDVRPADIDPGAPLFGAGLGLDSVDALELVVAMEKEFGIRIDSHEIGKEAFASVDALARFLDGRIHG